MDEGGAVNANVVIQQIKAAHAQEYAIRPPKVHVAFKSKHSLSPPVTVANRFALLSADEVEEADDNLDDETVQKRDNYIAMLAAKAAA